MQLKRQKHKYLVSNVHAQVAALKTKNVALQSENAMYTSIKLHSKFHGNKQ